MLDIIWLGVTVALLCAIVYLAYRSPLLGFILRVGLMALWGLATIGAAVFAAWLQINDGRPWGAVGALVVGGFLSIPWFAFAPEFFRAHFPLKRSAFKLWS